MLSALLGVPLTAQKPPHGIVGPCALWGKAPDAQGYGRRVGKGDSTLAHRVSYEATIGPIPAGLELDHLCRVRLCVNPRHLEPVTHAENMRRAARIVRPKAACVNGHDLMDPANVRLVKRPSRAGGTLVERRCKTCLASSQRRWQQSRGG